RGGWVEESPQDGPHGGRPVFRRYRDVPSKNPVARPRTRRARHRGGLSFGYFSLATQRKMTRAAAAARNRFVVSTSNKKTELAGFIASTRPSPQPSPRRGEGESAAPPASPHSL